MPVLCQNEQAGRVPPLATRIGLRSLADAARRLAVRLIIFVAEFSFRRAIKTSRRARHLLIARNIARHPWEFYARRNAARTMASAGTGFTISRAAGFGFFNASEFEELPQIVRLCERIYADDKRHLVKPPPVTATKHKGYLIELLNDEDLLRYPQLVEFCLSKPVAGAVARYLGTLPILRRVGLWLSFPAPSDGASRLFHLDPEDLTQVRLFVNIIDISTTQGPLTFLPADVSARVLERLWGDEKRSGTRTPQLRRWTDDEILTRAGSSECAELVGPAGSGAFVDTSRCLHFGSRMKPGTMHLVFQAQFLRYHFPYATATNRFDTSWARGNAMRARLLAQRWGYPCNWHDR